MSDAEKIRAAVRAAETADEMAKMYTSAADQKWNAIADMLPKFAHCQEKKDLEQRLRVRLAKQYT